MTAFDLVWQNFNPFRWASWRSTQYTVSWCTFHFCLWDARRGLVRSSFWILVILMHGIQGCKEYRLSVPARILSCRYWSGICDGVYTDCTSNMESVLEEIVLNRYIVCKEGSMGCVLNDLSLIELSSWFNINPYSFKNRSSPWRRASSWRSSWVCFSLGSACKRKYFLPSSVWRFPARCRRTPCRSSLWPICSGHKKFWPTSENSLCLQIQVWFPLHVYLASNWLWLPVMGPILEFPWIQHFRVSWFVVSS